MLKYFFLLFFAVFPFSSLSAEGIVLQEEECEKKIIELIEQSKEYIDVSVYSINNKKLVDALIRAHRRGIRLRVLTDKVQAAGKSSKIWDLIAAGFPLRVHTHKRIMHTKVAIYDGKSVSSGSFNWTEPAVHKNEEVCDIFVDDSSYVMSVMVMDGVKDEAVLSTRGGKSVKKSLPFYRRSDKNVRR